MSLRLDELVGATREAVHRRKRERPLAELEREAGVRAAEEAIDSGAAATVLDSFVARTAALGAAA